MPSYVLNCEALKALISSKDPSFWQKLSKSTLQADTFVNLQQLATLRRKAQAQGFYPVETERTKLRLAMIGGFTFHPLQDMVQQILFANQFDVDIWTGDYDNYVWEIMDESSGLYSFKPDFVVFLPSASRYKYSGKLIDSSKQVIDELERNKALIIQLCERINSGCSAEVILCNFALPCYHDPGQIRARTMASEWNSLKWLNQQIGLGASSFVQICDVEFLAARRGGLQARDDRGWFESKQPFSPDFMVDVAREIARQVSVARAQSKKVLVMDLDETIWGGVIGDDGLQGIELGDTSSRGQSFREFQRSILELSERGVLLAVCSKNDFEKAMEPFEKHPEMLLRPGNIASFKANWNPKSENINEMAQELCLSPDSFVFIDDNPAEIEIVNQFAPGVTTLWLGRDPAGYIEKLKDSRLFEPRTITNEDSVRAEQYQQDKQRQDLQTKTTDMSSYLESLQMEAQISDFNEIDVSRIAQLINRSNQFNLTTKRRSESEVARLIGSDHVCFTVRLKDRFGELGLISVIIGQLTEDSELIVDTWLMSCRVLKRQLEHLAMNELIRRACALGCRRVTGVYIPTEKNQMVKDFFSTMGFQMISSDEKCTKFALLISDFQEFTTSIRVERGANEGLSLPRNQLP